MSAQPWALSLLLHCPSALPVVHRLAPPCERGQVLLPGYSLSLLLIPSGAESLFFRGASRSVGPCESTCFIYATALSETYGVAPRYGSGSSSCVISWKFSNVPALLGFDSRDWTGLFWLLLYRLWPRCFNAVVIVGELSACLPRGAGALGPEFLRVSWMKSGMA